MSDSDRFPTDFIPVSRPLVEELGYQAAYIFGIVWNYCQMESGICNASHDTIANRAGMSRRSVITHLDELIDKGYVEDLTPDVRNAPHHLSTKKGVQILHSKERTIKEEEPIEEPGGYENPAHQNGVGMQELHSRCAKNAQPGMQILHKKRQSKKTKESSPKGDSGKPPTIFEPKEPEEAPPIQEPESNPELPPEESQPRPNQVMFATLAQVCRLDLGLITERDRGKLNNFEKRMRDKGYAPPDIIGFESWWYGHTWQGKDKDQAPSLDELYKHWGQYLAFLKGERGGSNPKNGIGPDQARASPKLSAPIDQEKLKKLQEGLL